LHDASAKRYSPFVGRARELCPLLIKYRNFNDYRSEGPTRGEGRLLSDHRLVYAQTEQFLKNFNLLAVLFSVVSSLPPFALGWAIGLEAADGCFDRLVLSLYRDSENVPELA
jgi:hypothetical protein